MSRFIAFDVETPNYYNNRMSAIGIVGMNTGIFNNPFISCGRYRKKDLQYELPISFQFHHTQMDGSHAGRFLENLQKEINALLMRG